MPTDPGTNPAPTAPASSEPPYASLEDSLLECLALFEAFRRLEVSADRIYFVDRVSIEGAEGEGPGIIVAADGPVQVGPDGQPRVEAIFTASACPVKDHDGAAASARWVELATAWNGGGPMPFTDADRARIYAQYLPPGMRTQLAMTFSLAVQAIGMGITPAELVAAAEADGLDLVRGGPAGGPDFVRVDRPINPNPTPNPKTPRA